MSPTRKIALRQSFDQLTSPCDKGPKWANYCGLSTWTAGGIPSIDTSSSPWGIAVDGARVCTLYFVGTGGAERQTLKCI